VSVACHAEAFGVGGSVERKWNGPSPSSVAVY
jgi:hypothetical protein